MWTPQVISPLLSVSSEMAFPAHPCLLTRWRLLLYAVCLPWSGEEDALNKTTSLMDWNVAWTVSERKPCFRHFRRRPRPRLRCYCAMFCFFVWKVQCVIYEIYTVEDYGWSYAFDKSIAMYVSWNKVVNSAMTYFGLSWGTSVLSQHFRFSSTNCTGQLSSSLAVKVMHCNSKNSLWFLQYWYIFHSTRKIWPNYEVEKKISKGFFCCCFCSPDEDITTVEICDRSSVKLKK